MTHCIHLIITLLLARGGGVEADLVIRNALLCDGTTQTAAVGDIAIRGDRIVAVGKFSTRGSPRQIEATGLVAAPGFIDLHTHSEDIAKPALRLNKNYLMQGVATVVTGNCGSGRMDIAKYLDEIAQNGAGTNVAHLIPHSRIRSTVLGTDQQRKPSPDELAKMKALVDEGMRAGAWGISTGLPYVPGCFADADELVELARVAGRHGGLFVSHIRNEGIRVVESVAEVIAIGQSAKLPVHISHIKVISRQAWGLSEKVIQLIEEAHRRGQKVTADQYPYIASSTDLGSMVIPSEYRSAKKLAESLADKTRADEVRKRIAEGIEARNGADALVIAKYAKNPAWQGKSLAAIAAQKGLTPVDLVIEIVQNGNARIVNFAMNEDEVRRFMRLPYVATASDGAVMLPDNSIPHPRSYGCFPRKIGRYALTSKTLSLEAAIRSASGLPADIFQIPERGYLRPGYFADVVVFDPKTFRDTATFTNPHQYATGVRFLFVNGKAAIANGKVTGELAGRVLRHKSPVAAADGHGRQAESGARQRGAQSEQRSPHAGVFDPGPGGLAVLK
ncbi:MAG: D-aminoacylase [Candidatus Sumerlaeia bacterium]|nr:D-aminoacylase [Candidatus Sumerlaeia bacterium]